MKIVLVHNFYGSAAPSGENRVFEMERKLLEKNGHEVVCFERYSDILRSKGKIGTFSGALMTPWNPFSAQKMRKLIANFAPDVVHAHNTFPMISPSIFPEAHSAGRILTLHNYRLVCPAAVPMRDGRVCTECIDKRSVWPSIRHGCYRKSRPATIPLALNVSLNRWRGTWHRDVERFIALSEFQRDKMALAGLPQDKIVVKPNFYPGTPKVKPFSERRNQAVFVGRLGEEKGVRDLINAWIMWGDQAPELKIIGGGSLRAELEALAAQVPQIKFLGQVEPWVAESEIASARMLILPSRWFEPFGMVLVEAFAMGTPVAVSDVGPLPSLAREAGGTVFRAGDPADLLNKVTSLWDKPLQLERISKASVKIFMERYSEDVNYRRLIDVYQQALLARSKRIK